MSGVAYDKPDVVFDGELDAGRDIRRRRYVDWILRVRPTVRRHDSAYSLTRILDIRANDALEVAAGEGITTPVRKVGCHDGRGRHIASWVRAGISSGGRDGLTVSVATTTHSVASYKWHCCKARSCRYGTARREGLLQSVFHPTSC